MANLRTELLKSKYNLTIAFESISNNKNLTFIKNKRKSYSSNCQYTFKTTENIEFLKEVIIILNLSIIPILSK